jgi:ceramide glucosyltransferase
LIFQALLLLVVLLLLCSWVFWLLTLVLTYVFYGGQGDPQAPYTPPVSILIPAKGLDAGAYENFASFCIQDYPEYELLIGIYDPADPARPLVERLQADFAERNIQVIVAQPPGVNRKAAMLHHLAGIARHPVIVAVDSDMRATPDYLRRLVAPLADPQVGLVTCTYRGSQPATFAARLEALYMGSTFLPLIIIARQIISMRFAMGATMVMPRSVLEGMGGFQVAVDYLADDFQVASRIIDHGYRIHLSRYVITNILGAMSLRDFWQQQERMATTNRVCRPVEYPVQVLYFSTPLALGLLLLTHLDPLAMVALLVSVTLRWWVAFSVARWTGNQEMYPSLVWLPIQDGLSALAWLVGLVGSEVVWRGQHFRVLHDGRMVPAGEAVTEGMEASKP